jgi:hypothetical protein
MSTPSGNPSLSQHAESAQPASQLDLFAAVDDRRRIEASLKWLLEEARSCRLPPAATLAPVAGLAPPEPDVPAEFYDDAVADRAEASMLLPEQEFMPRRLHLRRRRYVRGAAKFVLAVAIAGAVAIYVSAPADSVAPLSDMLIAINARLAALLPSVPHHDRHVANASAPDMAPMSQRALADDPETRREALAALPVIGEAAAVPAGTAQAMMAETVAYRKADEPTVGPAVEPTRAVTPETLGTGPAPAAPATALTAKEVAALVSRGRTYFAAGDLTAARLLFRRAANAGDAAAAIAMGSTYDPAVLAKHVVGGHGADVTEARQWYEKARQMGQPEGPSRIETLAHR